MTIGKAIDMVSLQLEDPSMKPQHAIAYPPLLIYDCLIMSKEVVMYSDKNKVNNHGETYMLKCVKMIPMDINSCISTPPTGMIWMQTKFPLPRFKGSSFYSVGSNDILGETYDYISYQDIKDLKGSRFAQTISAENKYTIINTNSERHLYLLGSKLVSLTIYGSFENVLDVLSYPTCGRDTSNCNFLDTPFDVPGEYLQTIIFGARDLLAGAMNVSGANDRVIDDVDGSRLKTVSSERLY